MIGEVEAGRHLIGRLSRLSTAATAFPVVTYRMEGSNHTDTLEHREPQAGWVEFDKDSTRNSPESSFTLVFPLADSSVSTSREERQCLPT